MKKLLYLFLTVLIVACSGEDGSNNQDNNNKDETKEEKHDELNPLFLEDLKFTKNNTQKLSNNWIHHCLKPTSKGAWSIDPSLGKISEATNKRHWNQRYKQH